MPGPPPWTHHWGVPSGQGFRSPLCLQLDTARAEMLAVPPGREPSGLTCLDRAESVPRTGLFRDALGFICSHFCSTSSFQTSLL